MSTKEKSFPGAFSSGRRGQLMMHSRELGEWMNIPNSYVENDLAWLMQIRTVNWAEKNCRNRIEHVVLDYSNMTFTKEADYWISQGVAALLCSRYRKDLLPEIRRIFVAAYVEDQEIGVRTFGLHPRFVDRLARMASKFPWAASQFQCEHSSDRVTQ